MKLKTLVLVLFYSNIIVCQTFERQLLMDIASGIDLRIVDIDGDGQLDIFAHNSFSLKAFLNRGEFNFSSMGVLSFGIDDENFDISYFNCIDFDGDGDQDLLYSGCSACGEPSNLHLLENINGTHFEFKEDLVTEFLSHSSIVTAVADFDMDGDEDFVFSGIILGNTDMYYFENINGNFERHAIYEEEDDLKFIGYNTIDIDNDSDLDLIAHESNNTMTIYLNNNGDFSKGETSSFSCNNCRFKNIVGDSNPDFYYTANNQQLMVVKIENGIIGEPEILYESEGFTTNFEIIDTDKDGDWDLLAGELTKNGVLFIENREGEYQVPIKINSVGNGARLLNTVDLDLDGNEEVLYSAQDEFSGIFEVSGINDFGMTHVLTSLLRQNNINAFEIDQIPGKEINVHRGFWAAIIHIGEGREHYIETIYNSNNILNDFHYEDLDEDGDKDAIVCDSESVFLLENKNGKFEKSYEIASETGRTLEVFDIDKDGDLDIFLNKGNRIKIILNSGNNIDFEVKDQGGGGDGSRMKDINQDGWMDVLVWNSGNFAQYFENDKKGGFTFVKFPDADRATYMDADDFDLDGDLDVLVTYIQGNNLRIFENENGQFSEKSFDSAPYGSPLLLTQSITNEKGFLYNSDFGYYLHENNLNFSYEDFELEESYSDGFIVDTDGNLLDDLVITSGSISTLYIYKDFKLDPTSSTQLISTKNPTIYPNPTNSYLEIDQQFKKLVFNVKVFGINGKKVVDTFNIEKIRLDHVAPGLYSVLMFNEKGKILMTQKLFISN